MSLLAKLKNKELDLSEVDSSDIVQKLKPSDWSEIKDELNLQINTNESTKEALAVINITLDLLILGAKIVA